MKAKKNRSILKKIERTSDLDKLQVEPKVVKEVEEGTSNIQYKLDVDTESNNDSDVQSPTMSPDDFFFLFGSPDIEYEFNNINFNLDVNPMSVDSAINAISAVNRYLAQLELIHPGQDKPSINFKITTPGGEIISGYRLLDVIQSNHYPVTTIATGQVASMGIPLLVSGKKRLATKNAIFLIHQLSGGVGGKYSEIYDHLKLIDMLQNKLEATIVANSKLTKAKIKELMSAESWFDAETALEYGLIDEII